MKHNWETKKLNAVLQQYRETIWIDNLKDYPQVTISKFDGIKLRGVKKGIEIGRKRQFKIDLKKYPFTFTFTRQGIQNEGTVGLCPIEVDGCIVTENMPLFFVKDIDPLFLNYYFQSNVFLKQLQKINALGTAQKSIHEDTFLDLEIEVPPTQQQKTISTTLEKIKSSLEKIKSLRGEQFKDINNLVFSKYTNVIENAEWLPMKEVAPIHRRQVDINPEETYFEIGVRSFGRGLFDNPSFKGSELTWQKPFWMKKGDLLFSNIKAWEGAVGLIPQKYDGWVGSHRYITCLPNLEIVEPEFLYYYFRTFEGVAKLSSASPGTVDRNRTLNNKLLQEIDVPIPSLELQREFVELLKKTDAIKEHHKQTEQELAELMPSLLDKAFKGELIAHKPIQPGDSLPVLQKEVKLPLAASHKTAELELAMVVALMESRLGITYGEVGIQKTVFNIEVFNPVLSKKYSFVNYHYGTYSAALKESLKINPFLGKKIINGNEVFTISSAHKKTVLDAISDSSNLDFVMSVNQLLDVYTSPFIGKHTDKIELLNTVTKLIIDLQTTDISTIYEGMKQWEIKQEGYKSKADKFDLSSTKKIIELLDSYALIDKLLIQPSTN